MPITRRFFSIGVGALITSAFVSKAVAHVERTSRPLFVAPDRVERDLYFYPEDGRISLGPDQWFDDVPVPTYREYLVRKTGRQLETQADIEFIEFNEGVCEGQLDGPVCDHVWATAWECELSPTAQAYRLLDGLDLGPIRQRPGKSDWREALEFVESFHPGDSSRVVFAEDPVTASLLQARLTELGTGLRLVTGSAS